MELYNAMPADQYIEEEPIELTYDQYVEGREHYRSIILRADAALRLAENPDFISLVMDGYLRDEPTRLAALMASGAAHKSTSDDCAEGIRAVAKFRTYMKSITEQGNTARMELESLEDAYEQSIKLD